MRLALHLPSGVVAGRVAAMGTDYLDLMIEAGGRLLVGGRGKRTMIALAAVEMVREV
ncbi:hypothetical protein [Actinomyces faecalis]|uniref:hypothetical protein n=1 Tax=Actinomyces faecalis TaxID=2722820 RepID=UPI001553C080|nr:hypothetical protein [Actinomyces faecalis]